MYTVKEILIEILSKGVHKMLVTDVPERVPRLAGFLNS